MLFNSGLAYWLNRRLGESHNVACSSALIGASTFFELAVAAAISLFGFKSGAAPATVVGVLIEVPVMLLVVRIVNDSRAGTSAARREAERPMSVHEAAAAITDATECRGALLPALAGRWWVA